jgi:CDP-diacylglycerol--inositol 3-phosphatidyltransferase
MLVRNDAYRDICQVPDQTDNSFLLNNRSLLECGQVTIQAISAKTIFGVLLLASLPGCVIKQLVNVVQIKTAADLCVNYDIQKQKSKSQ